MVTHYTRLAPLKAITSDFHKALVKKEGDKAKGQAKLAMERSVKKLTAQLTLHQSDIDKQLGPSSRSSRSAATSRSS